MQRVSWDEVWVNVARAVAKRSRCCRAQVGAVIVDPTNRIIATGYNGMPAGLPIPTGATCEEFCPRGKLGPSLETITDYSDCFSTHAEANALMFCDRRDRLGGAIYVTGDTCMHCARLIANSGLTRLVICGLNEEQRLLRRAESSYDLLRSSGVTVDTEQ